MSNPHARAQSLPVAPTTGPTCTSLRSMPVPMPAPGSIDELERIIAELLPPTLPTDLMSRRGSRAQRTWAGLAATPLYEAMTIWVMASSPGYDLERVDAMVRTAIAASPRVRDGQWSSTRLIDVVRKAGRRQEHREVHRHLGQPVRLVSYDAVPVEPVDEMHQLRPVPTSLGRAVVAHLTTALGPHHYMVTPSAAILLDRHCDIAVDHLNAVRSRTSTAEHPDGLVGLSLFAAARPTKRANKSNRITDVFGDQPQPTRVALSHLLLGTDRNPESALLWRHVSKLSPTDVPAEVVADWRADLPALTPAILAFSERRRRRMRDRSRRGENLRRVFDLAASGEAGIPGQAVAI